MNRFVRSQSVVSRAIAGETLAVPVRKGVADMNSIYSFNQVGNTVWEALANPQSLEELVGQVMREFAVDEAQAKSDVSAFLQDLLAAGLISES